MTIKEKNILIKKRCFKSAFSIKISLVVIILIHSLCANICAQNEKVFTNYPGKTVRLLAETYDKGILIQVGPNSTKEHLFLIKYSLEGKEIWKKEFINTLWAYGLTITSDSGFIMTTVVFMHPFDSSNVDTSGNIAILKFDKCARLQWARYVKTTHQGANPFNVIENKGNFFLSAEGINGNNDHFVKAVSLLKFDNKGNLSGNVSEEGHGALLYNGNNTDTIYFSQDMYVPVGRDTAIGYLFSGIHSMDNSLHSLNNVIVGYDQRMYNAVGPLIVKDNSVEESSVLFFTNGKEQPMFSVWNKSLSLPGSFYYDSTNHFSNIYPLYSIAQHDSLVTYNWISTATEDTEFSALRLYDHNYKLLKEAVIDKNWFDQADSYLPLKNGNMIASTINLNTKTGEINNSSFYLFDRQLNPVPWPVVPPARGYDWACTSSIPASQVIYVDSVVKPVYVAPDYSKPDWQALGIKEPENATVGQMNKGWLVWPQPATGGGALFFKRLNPVSPTVPAELDIQFYDLQGRLIACQPARPAGRNAWMIPELNIDKPGAYLIKIKDKYSGKTLGNITIEVK